MQDLFLLWPVRSRFGFSTQSRPRLRLLGARSPGLSVMFWIYQPMPDFVGTRDSFLSWIPCAVARSDPAPTIEFAPPVLPASTSFRF
jgi:hypothetical protein